MKRLTIILTLILSGICSNAQTGWWVMLKDKAGTTFDPYSYFDAKAIERYRLNGADLYDESNYPLNSGYVAAIDAIVEEDFGQSRWLNAVAVVATDEQIAAIRRLPFVKETVRLGAGMQPARTDAAALPERTDAGTMKAKPGEQLLRMKGDLFAAKGIDGSGVRIAVFDGGFRAVNTHRAFKHLRDSGRIVATWDFTRRQADVYDNHGHGTMVLSCIAGQMGDKQLGLATGATFLLAKTEVDPEPYKEEVWWAQAVEWADKNGADIINSSLGYSKDRHYTWEMDGRSHVAKAANLAARKGILVCNSAGNEGENTGWKIVSTPADADSVLTVGGINPSLNVYSHIAFSSYGPTADGRMKPNVCNYGYCEVADPTNDDETDFAAGTSFSSPLTAGFCACAMQAMRTVGPTTAMEMKTLVEQSADLYPYYDYALGYGVPQADFFTDKLDGKEQTGAKQPTFRFEDRGLYVLIHPVAGAQAAAYPDSPKMQRSTSAGERADAVMFKTQDGQGHIDQYVNLGVKQFDEGMAVAIPKGSLYGKTLVAYVNGYTERYNLTAEDSLDFAVEDHTFDYHVIDTNGMFQSNYQELGNRTIADNYVSNWGIGRKYLAEMHFQLGGGGMLWSDDESLKGGLTGRVGIRMLRHFRKWYALGVGMDFGVQNLFYNKDSINCWDNALGLTANPNVTGKAFELPVGNIELFQRIRLTTKSPQMKGLYWDLGIYGGLQSNNYSVQYNKNQAPNNNGMTAMYNNVKPAANQSFNWGFTTRIVYNWFGLYARLRMSQPDIDVPRFELGLQFSL